MLRKTKLVHLRYIFFAFLLLGCGFQQEKGNKDILVEEQKTKAQGARLDTIIYPDFVKTLRSDSLSQIFSEKLSSFEVLLKNKDIIDPATLVYKDEQKTVFVCRKSTEIILEDRKNDLMIAIDDASKEYTDSTITEIIWVSNTGCPKYALRAGLTDLKEPDVLFELELLDETFRVKGKHIALNGEKMLSLTEISYDDIIRWDKLLKQGNYTYLDVPEYKYTLNYLVMWYRAREIISCF